MTLPVDFFIYFGTWSDSCSAVLGVIAVWWGGNVECFGVGAGMQHFYHRTRPRNYFVDHGQMKSRSKITAETQRRMGQWHLERSTIDQKKTPNYYYSAFVKRFKMPQVLPFPLSPFALETDIIPNPWQTLNALIWVLSHACVCEWEHLSPNQVNAQVSTSKQDFI